jgi:hypothetical protein
MYKHLNNALIDGLECHSDYKLLLEVVKEGIKESERIRDNLVLLLWSNSKEDIGGSLQLLLEEKDRFTHMCQCSSSLHLPSD